MSNEAVSISLDIYAGAKVIYHLSGAVYDKLRTHLQIAPIFRCYILYTAVRLHGSVDYGTYDEVSLIERTVEEVGHTTVSTKH